MDTIRFYAPEEQPEALSDLKAVPFAKVDGGYQFASWVYDLNNDEKKRAALWETDDGEAGKLLQAAREELDRIVISEDDYMAWMLHKKEAGGVKQYHEIIHTLSIKLLMLNIKYDVDEITSECHATPDKFFSQKDTAQSQNGARKILNRKNPFADVTIKSQQFFYKTAENSTETLFFDTNNIVEDTEKNGKHMLSMRPGFSVSKEYGIMQKPTQKITFSGSMTEPIAEDDDHIYIHID